MKDISRYQQKEGFTPLEITKTSIKSISNMKTKQVFVRSNKMRRSSRKDDLSLTGFTILEVMIAMVVLVVGVFSTLSILTSALQQRAVSREYDIAKNAAVAKIEEIKAFTFSDIYGTYEEGVDKYFDVPGLVTRADKTDEGMIVIDNTNTDLLDISVCIYWRTRNGKDEEFKMQTMVAQSE